MTGANHVTDCLLMLTPSTAAAATAAIEFHGSMTNRHAHLRSSCQTQTHSRVPLPVDSLVHLRKQHPNSAGPPPPVFLHTEVPLQIPAVTAAPALALQLGIIRRWRACRKAHYPSPVGKTAPTQDRGDRKTDRQSGVFVNLAHILTQPGRPFPSPSRISSLVSSCAPKVRCPATSESPKGPLHGIWAMSCRGFTSRRRQTGACILLSEHIDSQAVQALISKVGTIVHPKWRQAPPEYWN